MDHDLSNDYEYFDYVENLLVAEVLDGLNNRKNHAMIRQLITDAGSNYIEEGGLSKLQFYSDNLARVDSLKSFVDDEGKGLLAEAFSRLFLNCSKIEAVQRYILNHEKVAIYPSIVVRAATKSGYIFFKLIEAGANVHHVSSIDGFTALHVAVIRKRKNIIKYLLDQNVDVNCYNQYTRTPLHYAFRMEDNLDIIELLIQKGADLFLSDDYSLTPLEYGIIYRQFNDVSSVLKLTATANIITYDLLKKLFSCFCLNNENDENDFLRRVMPQLIYDYYDFFKFLYEKLVANFIANHNTTGYPLLSIYLNNIVFESQHWANALTVILTSEIASSLLEECLSYERESIYVLLIPKLIRAKVNQVEDRLKLFNCLLSLKMNPNLKDMALILSHYRFDEEFRLLSPHLREDSLINNYNRENPMEYLACVFCGLEDDLDYNAIFGQELPEEFYNYIKQYFTPALSNCSSRNGEMDKPNILSLREISRNSARKYIKNINKILSPKDFNFAVQSMRIPLKCKNFILLLSTVDEFLN